MTLVVVLLLGTGALMLVDAFSADAANGGQPYTLLAIAGLLWQGITPAVGGVGAPINNPTTAQQQEHRGAAGSPPLTSAHITPSGGSSADVELGAAAEWVRRGRG